MNRRTSRIPVISVIVAMAVLPRSNAAAQAPAPKPSAAPAAAAPAPGADRLTPSELEELLGGIALYPDVLLANVLAASVYPDEVAEAAKFVAGGGMIGQVDAKPWEDPVKAVAKIPDVIKMMGQYKEWVIALGQAYLTQSKDVMDVVQSLRAKAQANGALRTTPEQKVVVEEKVIYIKPSDPEVIYVPSYSPSVVYVDNDDNDAVVAGVVGFGLGMATGLILANNMDCHWHGGCVGYGYHGGDFHGGNYRSGNEINVNGDVNIGNRNNNVSGNNVGNRANAGNRVGNEGNAWAPNKNKSLASSKQNETGRFKGGANSANRPATPGGGRGGGAGAANRPGGGGGAGAANRPGAGGGAGAANRPGAGGAGAANRPGAGGGAGAANRPGAGGGAQAGARPAQQPAARPSASPAGGSSRGQLNSFDSPPRSSSAQGRQSGGSAYSGGRGTQAQSQRGAASRSQSSVGASRSSGASRSAGASRSGGASRGGGGGGRRGR